MDFRARCGTRHSLTAQGVTPVEIPVVGGFHPHLAEELAEQAYLAPADGRYT